MSMLFKLPLNDVENEQIMGKNAIPTMGGGVNGVTPKVATLKRHFMG
jgi:hypothetical protein